MSSRNLTALAVAVVAGVTGGVYTFGPILKEQQKAQEVWKDPGPAQMGDHPQSEGAQLQDQTNHQGSNLMQKK